MKDRVTLFIVVSLALAATTARRAAAQGYPPAEAASHMTVPDGLEVTLFAAEPMVRQPVCIEFDDRGRMWVVQYLQYPNPAGLSRVKVDRYSRTVYDKMPEPPPKGVKGADRITILQDTNGDGTPDASKDFVNGLNITSGLAFGHGGVFVLNPPYLLFYTDRNRDDVPDGDPEVLLTGFGIEDAHSVANSLTWGPDGWLYGCQGSTVTANIRGIEFQQGVWRYHPLSKKFELFCEGGGNSWGLDFDPHGNLLYNTNHGGFVMLHGVQGAYYWKSFGKHGPLHNPHAYGYFDHVPHANFTGGHVGNGGIVYQGDGLPETFRGKFISNDLLGHAVRFNTVEPVGSSFKSAFAGDLLLGNDTWFAPCDMTMGPDGAVYVADWSDQRTAHPDPDADWDSTNGRVYRIASKGRKFEAGPDYSKLSRDELLAMLSKPDNWVARKARRELASRRDPEVIPPLRRMITEGGDEQRTTEALWALYVSGGFTEEFVAELLAHKNADVRRWTIRFLGDEGHVSAKTAHDLALLASHDSSVHVRSQLASTAKRLPPAEGLMIVQFLLRRSGDRDADDPHVPLLIWWAVEHHALAGRRQLVGYLTSREAWESTIVRSTLVARVMRRYAAEGMEDGLRECALLLEYAPPAERARLLAALDQGLGERPGGGGGGGAVVRVPAALDEYFSKLWRDDTTDPVVIRFFARLGRPAGVQRALALAADAQQPADLRARMIEIVGQFGDDAKTPMYLLGVLRTLNESEAVLTAALTALSRFDDDVIADKLLTTYAHLPPNLKPKVIDVLLGRPKWAPRLLDAIDAGKIAPADVSLDQLRQVSAHNDKALDARIAKRWGKITGGTPEEKLAEVRRFNNDLRAASGDRAKGRELFTNTCAVCHKLFDEGGAVGPDLTHANRTDRNYLLVSIVDPNAVIRAEHLSYLLRTTDGRVLSGLLIEQTPAAVTLLDAKAQRVTVSREKVKDLKESPVSLMPEGLLTPFKPQELRDLFAYLQSDGK